MRNQGVGTWPARRARMTPRATAVRFADTVLTYAELDTRVTRLARHWRERGVRAGDRVAHLGPNRPAFLECLFAAGLLGAVFVPLNVRLSEAELARILAHCGARFLDHAPEHADRGTRLASAANLTVLDGAPARERGPVRERPDEPVSLEDPAVLLYTSGSTGAPKGVTLTHGNLTWNCVNVLVESDVATDEVTLVVAPLFHAAALGMSCLPTLLKGGAVVLHDQFDPAEVLAAVERHRITWMFGVPRMFDALAAHPHWDSADLSSLRTLSCGGAPVPTATIRRYLDRGLSFVQGYGMTEAAPGVTILDRAHAQAKAGSAGVPSFFTDVRVVSPDGRDVAPGERGEVVVSGPNLMAGYWEAPEETARAVRDGWFHSGDVATVDEGGYLYVVDRLKDMFISGGENVYPAEVENVLHEHPDVAACAVIGVPDAVWGEVGRAVVVPADGAEPDPAQLREWLRSRLAAYKVPRDVVLAEELPTTGSGKLRKSAIRDRYGH
ncbi:p-hydroxycinnamoyl-CoA synthetase [Saccharomonospora piscinae]|uniref:p-hydroxycinnamoyl-CoA synthetase n=1 Tax=Saccharomonospora piscinae TaxID=687388 RepID=A0A1V9A7K7_SACPI|nr:long-chain fatty acid--CoA ligase [Saccharomonospora piscinae]OQO93081.1 p-hydroxycinnamoyl-CoA synthetase [Saccharomonospora piscinae]